MLSADRAAVARSVPDLRGRLGPRPAQQLSGRAERSGSVAITWHVLEAAVARRDRLRGSYLLYDVLQFQQTG